MNKTKIEWTDELTAEQQRRNIERGRASKVKRARKVPKSPDMLLKEEGHVYLLRRGDGLHKIGMTAHIKSRTLTNARTWEIAAGRGALVHSIHSPHMSYLETILHSRFADKNIHAEWFDLTPIDVAWIVNLGGQLDDDQLERLASWERLRPRF